MKYVNYSNKDLVATITLARGDKANAQNEVMLDELHECFLDAEKDDSIKVIVLRAEGKHFSAGHDLDASDADAVKIAEPDGTYRVDTMYRWEARKYFGYSWKWRNIPKPTMVEVQGWVIAGGLMLVWPFDIIIAADDTKFTDPVVALGVNGVEYFAHPWEFGTRKAKEMLFTGEVIRADEAKSLGMVNHVVSREELTDFTMAMAENIARRPMMGLKLAKQSVNQAEEAQGLYSSLQAAMSLQQLGHSHWRIVNENGAAVNLEGGALMKEIFDKHKKPKKAE